MLTSALGRFWRYRDLVANLVLRDLRVKYKGSSLGFAWSFLHPLLMAAVYTLAFQYVVRIQVEHFPVFLLAGLLPWTFFVGAVSLATGSVADNAPLVRKVAFPRMVLPLSAVLSQFAQFLLMYAAVVPVAAALGVAPSLALVALVPLVGLELVFVSGLALIGATAYVHFRDTRHLLDVLMQVWFWATPIVYPLDLVPERFRWIAELNPMTLVVESCHVVVLDHAWPPAAWLAALTAWAVAALGIGGWLFLKHERRFAELI
mgnify:CR=1 FL=1